MKFTGFVSYFIKHKTSTGTVVTSKPIRVVHEVHNGFSRYFTGGLCYKNATFKKIYGIWNIEAFESVGCYTHAFVHECFAPGKFHLLMPSGT